jgi:hypothetical protein
MPKDSDKAEEKVGCTALALITLKMDLTEINRVIASDAARSEVRGLPTPLRHP